MQNFILNYVYFEENCYNNHDAGDRGGLYAQTPQEEYEAWKKQAQGNYSRYRQQANDDYQAFPFAVCDREIGPCHKIGFVG